ncbi:DnaB-like helicase N-terminal domain-containing protein [Prauserella muralis]|uniref:Uncharacterized protein n=1 Tax=Prauserella muralis TaxID=588067 RepID=A0A2V4ACH8_9PSEU|nr:DnaB-like helicase N-terminal domain-containing protein [Prauserella muralis]PXY16595.1 hypothetical protein BAY60_35980 [Prauserella muralis]TWE11160.1 DnaB helicase-like protein [Prauserella muralis]
MNPREFAERCLLGVLMSQPGRLAPISRWLEAEDFHSPAHGTIYAHLRAMVEAAQAEAEPGQDPASLPGVDAVSLYERIAASGELGTHELSAPRLHTLMATAPSPQQARPESYGLMVLEASIRRRVAEGGMRVEQYVEQATDVADLLRAVDNALADVDRAQQRWDSVTGLPNLTRVLEGESASAPDQPQLRSGPPVQVLLEPPDEQQVQAAEQAVVASVLSNPRLLEQLYERLLPSDFADERLATTYRSALELHARGEHIDMVTVAWEQQRHEYDYGPGITPEEMLALTEHAAGDPAYHADVVMRGAVTRLTRAAAEKVQQAAQHPGLQPGDVLHTTRMAYAAVRDTAARMYSQGSTPARLAGLSSPVPLDAALQQPDGSPPSPRRLRAVPPPEPDRGR